MKSYGLNPLLNDQTEGFVCGIEGGSVEEVIKVGRLTEYGPPIDVLLEVSGAKVIAVFGKRGQGKSYTLGSLIEGLITKEANTSISRLKERKAVLLFDTLDIYQWMGIPLNEALYNLSAIKNQAKSMEGWEIKPDPLQVKIWAPPGPSSSLQANKYEEFFLQVSDFSLEEWGLLLGLDTVRDIKGQLLAEVYQKATNIGWEHQNGSSVQPTSRYTIENLLECLENDVDFQNGVYHGETVRAIRQQLISFSRLPLFQGKGTPLRNLLIPGQISVILLNRLSEDMRSVLVSVIIRRLMKERAEASIATKDLMVNPHLNEEEKKSIKELLSNAIPKTWIVIDEAQNVIPSDKKTFATASLVKLVKEGRNFGLSFVVTTQQPKSLDRTIMSQVETFIVHKLVAYSDIEYILENMKCPFPNEIKEDIRVLTPRELLRDISRGQAVVADTNSPRAFVMEVRPRISVHGGFEA